MERVLARSERRARVRPGQAQPELLAQAQPVQQEPAQRAQVLPARLGPWHRWAPERQVRVQALAAAWRRQAPGLPLSAEPACRRRRYRPQ